MARSIADIQKQITDTWVANLAAIDIDIDPTTWSVVNLMRLFIYTIAFCTNVLEQLFDLFKTDVNVQIANLTPHTARWYANKAKAFQYGFNLLPDSDLFDNTGKTDDEIAASMVVKYAAVVELVNQYGRVSLRIKVAGTDGKDLIQLPDDVMTAFRAYMELIKDAGVKLQIDSLPPDSIKQTYRVFYDPLILSATGTRLDGSDDTPVQDAIKAFLINLPFNGIYVIQYNIDAIQDVEGVVTLDMDLCQTQYGEFPFTGVDTIYTPDAGYLRFASDDDLVITWVPQAAIK